MAHVLNVDAATAEALQYHTTTRTVLLALSSLPRKQPAETVAVSQVGFDSHKAEFAFVGIYIAHVYIIIQLFFNEYKRLKSCCPSHLAPRLNLVSVVTQVHKDGSLCDSSL